MSGAWGSPRRSPAPLCLPRSPAASPQARWPFSPTPATCSPTSPRWRSPGSGSGCRGAPPTGGAPTASTAFRCWSPSPTAWRCSPSPRGSSTRRSSGSMTTPEVSGGIMVVIAALGLLVNVAAFALLRGADRDNLNIRGAAIHVLGDLLGSVAALIAGGVILFTGWTPIDPAALSRGGRHHREERLAGGGRRRAYSARRRAGRARHAGDSRPTSSPMSKVWRRCITCMSGRSPRAGAW